MSFPPLFVEYSLAAEVSFATLGLSVSQSQTTTPLSIPETINISFDLVADGSRRAFVDKRIQKLIIASSLYQYFQLCNRQIVFRTIAYCSQIVKPKEFRDPLIRQPAYEPANSLSTLQKVISLAVEAGPYCTSKTLLMKRMQLQAFLLAELPGLLSASAVDSR
jgi:hypothetical protein